jgi:hypothetical protein
MNQLAKQFLSEEAIVTYARELDPQGNREFADGLDRLSLPELFDSPIRDSEMAACCHSGLWLLNNFLHQSHEISQSIDSAEGSWWHAIMHRTEGDFSNAKYWYRRVGSHEAMLDVDAGQESFDAADFVDRCQQEYRNGPLSDETQATAFAEWQALFNFCYRNSI